MKKSLLFALAAVAMLSACNNADEAKKSGEATSTTEVTTVECVASGDVVYMDLDFMLASSKLYAAEGKALEAKMQEFQTRAVAAQEGWTKKEQSTTSCRTTPLSSSRTTRRASSQH